MSVQDYNVGTGAQIINASGSIATGTTSQEALPANYQRRFMILQNPSTETEPLYYDFDTVATIATTSPELGPGDAALFDIAVPINSLRVNATTTGHKYFLVWA